MSSRKLQTNMKIQELTVELTEEFLTSLFIDIITHPENQSISEIQMSPKSISQMVQLLGFVINECYNKLSITSDYLIIKEAKLLIKDGKKYLSNLSNKPINLNYSEVGRIFTKFVKLRLLKKSSEDQASYVLDRKFITEVLIRQGLGPFKVFETYNQLRDLSESINFMEDNRMKMKRELDRVLSQKDHFIVGTNDLSTLGEN